MTPMLKLATWSFLLARERRAVTALEYAFIGAVVAAVMVVGATSLGISLSANFVSVAGHV